jgi:DeoR family transcriptional regulator, fructose operon transcriptional repressor
VVKSCLISYNIPQIHTKQKEVMELLVQDRYKKICDILERENSVKVTTLTNLFGVSVETIRRDLEYLEGEGLLKRVHGGAVLERINGLQSTFNCREDEYKEQKAEIGEIASRYIREGQSIAVDVSTTNYEVIKVLKQKFKKLTIITNSLSILNELADMEGYTVIALGGILRGDELSFIGAMAEENISKFHVDTAFISMSGISLREGLTDYGFGEVSIKKKMMKIAQENIVLADSSKFDVVSLLKVCDFNDINMIITDSSLKQSLHEKYQKNGIEVINK